MVEKRAATDSRKIGGARRMIALYKSVVDGIIPTASSQSSVMPLSNLLVDTLTEFSRIASGDNYIQYPLSAQVDAIGIAGWGMNALLLQFSNDPTFPSSSILNEYEIPVKATQPDTGSVILTRWFDPITAAYCRILTTGDGKKDFGKIMLGNMAEFPYMSASQSISLTTTKKNVRGIGGTKIKGDIGYNGREYEVTFPEYNDAGYELFEDLWNTCHNQKAFFSVLWDDRQNILPILYGSLEDEKMKQDRTELPMFPWTTKLHIAEEF